ncbi:MAG: cytidine deaminase [Candidatus Micrarchaeota archaeon]
MAQVSNEELIKRARAVAKKRVIVNKATAIKTGEVGAALVTDKGNVYVGVSIGADCGTGFCAESSAIAAMATAGEHKIKKIVAVSDTGIVIPPCGRCREIIYEINNSADVDVVLGKNKVVKLKKLLPEIWQEKFY